MQDTGAKAEVMAMTNNDSDTKVPVAFTSLEWCREIYSDPAFISMPVVLSTYEGHNPFWNELLVGPRGIRAAHFIYRPHLVPSPSMISNPTISSECTMESRELFDLGPALVGQRGICHGGFLAAIMDQAAGKLIHVYKLSDGGDPFTITLNMRYMKPVLAPSVIMAKGRVTKCEGRKIWLETSIVDQHGDVCTMAESFFLAKRQQVL